MPVRVPPLQLRLQAPGGDHAEPADRTTTGDLRERLAHAMAHAPGTAYQACNDDMYLRLADAALPVVEAWVAERAPSLLQGSPAAGSKPLRDRIADALATERWGSKHDLGEHGRHSFYAPCGICQGDVAAIVRLVLPVVEAALARLETEIDDHIIKPERALHEQTIQRAEQAEAAVRRVRELADNADADMTDSFARQFGGAPFPATVPTEVLRTALDTEPPTGQPALTEVVTEEATRLAATATSGVDATEVTVNLDAEHTTAAPRPDGTWTIAVQVPIGLPVEMRHALFSAVAAAVSGWEPDDRDGWDADVSGYPTADSLHAWQAEATVQRSREALAAFDGRGVSTPEGTDWNIPTAGEVLDAWRASLDSEPHKETQ